MVKNTAPINEFLMKENEVWKRDFAKKCTRDHPEWDNTTGICVRWFICFKCFCDCGNKASHLGACTVPTAKCDNFKNFLKKICRENSPPPLALLLRPGFLQCPAWWKTMWQHPIYPPDDNSLLPTNHSHRMTLYSWHGPTRMADSNNYNCDGDNGIGALVYRSSLMAVIVRRYSSLVWTCTLCDWLLAIDSWRLVFLVKTHFSIFKYL